MLNRMRGNSNNRCKHDAIRDILQFFMFNENVKKTELFYTLNINAAVGNKYFRALRHAEMIISLEGDFGDWDTVYDITPNGVLWLNLYSQIESIL